MAEETIADAGAGRTRATEAELFARLEALNIRTTTVHHAPVATVAEARAHRGALPGVHCKCLFLKDKSREFWLVAALEERQVDLRVLARVLGARRFSFASPEQLRAILGVEPGAVTPFALINDRAGRVRVGFDAAILAATRAHFHPLVNTATTAIVPADLARFIADTGHPMVRIDFDTASAATGP